MNNKTIIYGIIIAGILGIILAGVFILNEMEGAKDFCDSVNKNHSLEYDSFEFSHFCGDREIFRYENGWNFNKSLKILLPSP